MGAPYELDGAEKDGAPYDEDGAYPCPDEASCFKYCAT